MCNTEAARLPTLPGKDGAKEQAQTASKELLVMSEAATKGEGKRYLSLPRSRTKSTSMFPPGGAQ
jgi:hypothetical protein